MYLKIGKNEICINPKVWSEVFIDKINVVFKPTNGSMKIVTKSLDKRAGELICLFLKKNW